jgi:dTDP-4-dehydrorhamnose reductase
VNYYGETKLKGEELVMKHYNDSIIIRTSWVYSSYGRNFVKTMLKLMKERDTLAVVADQFGCPTYAADLAGAVMQLIQDNKLQPGIYHYCNQGIITWHQFATAIRDASGNTCTIQAIPTSAYPTAAKRPGYSALDTSRLREAGIPILPWKQSLDRCLQLLGDQ